MRSLRKPGDVDRLRQLPGAAERLELVEADLMRPGWFDAPVVGCDVVLHTASPYVIDVKDPQRDLVDQRSTARAKCSMHASAPDPFVVSC